MIDGLFIPPLFILTADNFRDHEMLRGCRRITELDLSHNRLVKIPDRGLKVLTKLEKLFLSHNAITSPMFGPGFQPLEVRISAYV